MVGMGSGVVARMFYIKIIEDVFSSKRFWFLGLFMDEVVIISGVIAVLLRFFFVFSSPVFVGDEIICDHTNR